MTTQATTVRLSNHDESETMTTNNNNAPMSLTDIGKAIAGHVSAIAKAVKTASAEQLAMGKLLVTVDSKLQTYFPAENGKGDRKAYAKWYRKLGLDKFQVNNAIARAHAVSVLGVRQEAQLNTAHIKELATVLTGKFAKASGSNVLLPEAERKANALSVIAKAKELGGDGFSGSHVAKARELLNFKSESKTPRTPPSAPITVVLTAIATVDIAGIDFSTVEQDDIDTVLLFAANLAQAYENMQPEAEAEATA